MTLRRFAATILVSLGLLQAAWIAVVPPFRGIDEIDHAYRAAAVGHGEWNAGPYAENGRGRLVRVPVDMVDAAHAQCEDLPYMLEENCNAAGESEDGIVEVASSAASYQPLTYAATGWVSKFLPGSEAVIGMRVVTALLCLLLFIAGASCLFLAGAGTVTCLGILLVLSPVTLYSTAVVSPNGVEMASAFALWCALLALGRHGRVSHEQLIVRVAGIAVVILAGTRTLGPFFAVAIVAFSISFGWSSRRWVLRRSRAVLLWGTAAILSGVGQIIWYATVNRADIAREYEPSSFLSIDLGSVLANVFLWPLQMIAAFPYRNQSAPPVVYVVFTLLFCGMIAMGIKTAARRERLVLILLLVGALTMPFLLTWFTYSSRGVIWQGRYGLPLAFGVPLMACLLSARWKHRASKTTLASLWLLLTVMHSAGLLKVLHDESKRDASLLHSGWHQPSGVALVSLVILASGLLCYTAHRMEATRDATDLDTFASASGHHS